MDVCLVIQQRLKELGLEQRDLAAAAQVTESYISQLLTRKKAPPAANRTDIYEKMNAFLKLPKGHLSAIVEAQRREEWKKAWANPPAPLYREVRDLIVRKCHAARQKQVREIFEKQAFGELERLVTQKLLDVTKRTARAELENELLLRRAAKLRKQSYEEARTVILEFLDTDLFSISAAHCAAFLAPLDRILGHRSDHVCLARQFASSDVSRAHRQFSIYRAGRRKAAAGGTRFPGISTLA